MLGKVDIYVRGTFNIKQDIHINKDGLSDNLNIYVYNTNNNEYGQKLVGVRQLTYILWKFLC